MKGKKLHNLHFKKKKNIQKRLKHLQIFTTFNILHRQWSRLFIFEDKSLVI